MTAEDIYLDRVEKRLTRSSDWLIRSNPNHRLKDGAITAVHADREIARELFKAKLKALVR